MPFTNYLCSGPLNTNVSLLLLGRPHLIHAIRTATCNTNMETIYIEAENAKEDLTDFVRRSIAQRLRLAGASEYLRDHIKQAVTAKAQGMFLWANLMLEILEFQTIEEDIRMHLRTAPQGIDDMTTEMLEVYSTILKGREAEELNSILTWVSCAARPLTLAELDAVLRRLSPSAGPVLALEERLRTTYASLIELTRDDGLSNAGLRSKTDTGMRASLPKKLQ